MVYKDLELFGSYLAGLWEGDGNIRLAFGNAKPSISITFHKCDAPLAEKLLLHISSKCNKAKVGAVYYHKKRHACYLTLYSVEALVYFVTLVNGKLRSPKAYQIDLIIDWLNKNNKSQIKKCGLTYESISNDAWLAGFIDADGSFAIRQTLESQCTKKLTECQFMLFQRIMHPKTKQSYMHIFEQVASFLCVKLKLVKARNSKAQDQYKIKVSSANSKTILRSYLDGYPLLSSKRLNYEVWCAADNYMKKQKHYTVKGAAEITALKRTMNKKRTVYNWAHLEF